MGAASLWRGPAPLLLASTSRIRLALLISAGLPVDAEAPGVDERAAQAGLGPGVTPAEVALHLAVEKALAVSRRHPDRVVVGADQVLDLDGRAISKAESSEAAVRLIGRLAGRTHALRSGLAVAREGAVLEAVVADASLAMRALDEAAVRLYVDRAGGAATRSAGGYEIEGIGIHLFERVEGEHSTILGLPLIPLLAALRRHGLLTL